jgi:Domain of unknown function (DUF4112)
VRARRGNSPAWDHALPRGLVALTLRRPAEHLRGPAWLGIDAARRLPGTALSLRPSSVIGLAPGAGDALLTLISLYIVYEAARLGLPRAKIIRTLANVAVEAGLGVVPLLGDLLDVVWKANLRNVAIIDEHFGMMPNR